MDDSQYSNLFSTFLQDTRTLVEGRWFAGQTIDIDGYHFKNCRFDNCTIRYEAGDFQFTSCLFNNVLTMHSARTTPMIRLFMRNFPGFDSLWPQFAPQRHPDGTVSINQNLYPQ